MMEKQFIVRFFSQLKHLLSQEPNENAQKIVDETWATLKEEDVPMDEALEADLESGE
jgi:hypothetical protein